MTRHRQLLPLLLTLALGCPSPPDTQPETAAQPQAAPAGEVAPEAEEISREATPSATSATSERGHGHGHSAGHERTDGATTTQRFDQVELWAKRFESPGRDEWQEPARVIELLKLQPQAKIADIGAATGYFPVLLARAVPQGLIYGVDIEPKLVNYLNLRARKEGLTNLISLVCTADDPALPEPVDLIFVCNTFHHIDGRSDYFRGLHDDLRPGGRLAVVDWKLGDFPVGPPNNGHKLPATQVKAELAEAGYELLQEEDLTYQYVLIFRAVD